MSVIPLLNLPSFAQEIIVSSLDPALVLGITLSSKIMHRIVSMSKYSRIPVTQLTAHRGSVEILTGEGPFLNICHGPDCFWKVKEIECFEFRNGFHLKYGAHQEKLIIEHLLSVFNISQFEVYAEFGTFEGLTIFQYVKKFTSVDLAKIPLTASQLKFLLEDIQTDSLILHDMPEVTEYQGDIVFKHRDISIYTCINIPFAAILSMNSESLYVELNVTDSTIPDLVRLIGQWISGEMEHLKRLHIVYENLTDEIGNSVMQEIEQMDIVLIRQEFPSEGIIIRPDRKRASVKFSGLLFQFITS